jgi:hypothetical protein
LAVCQRFDVGLTWLFALLLLKLLLTVGAGLHFTEHVSEGLIVPFFCFGVLALAVARNTSGQQKRFMSGYRGIGLVGGFVALVALLGTGAALLFTPYLQALSVAGYSELKHADPTFLRLLAGLYMLILSWWLKDHKPEHPRITPRNEDKGAGSPIPGGRPHLRLEETESLAFWLVIGTVAALVTGAIVWGIWKVHAQTPARARGPHWWEWLRAWLAHLFRQTQLLVQRILPGAQRDPVQLYLALLRWGRRSGIPHRPDETALEYAERLQARVRPMHAEIALIVATFNQHAYAQSACDGKTLSETQRALRRLHSPRLWPTRVSLWFAGEESLST